MASGCVGFDGIVLHWTALDWTALSYIGLVGIALGRKGLEWIASGLDWIAFDWIVLFSIWLDWLA